MDLAFNAEERAFQDEVRGFIAKNLTEEMKRATALTPSVFSDPDIGMAWQRVLHKPEAGARRAGRSNTAARTGRRRSAGSSRPNPRAPACPMST